MSTTTHRSIPAATAIALVLAIGPARGEEPGRPPSAAIGGAVGARHPIARPGAGRGAGLERSGATGGWGFGWIGVGLVLAACGIAGVVARRGQRAVRDTTAQGLRVVGRTPLGPRHAVYLVRAGDRLLLVGTGAQGPPSLLGELEDSEIKAARDDAGAAPPPRTIPTPAGAARRGGG
jgi:flagellar protein FliO/FliZ